MGDKEVWLITHDNYIDRRIFFFADVFQENGCEVKLFPSTYFELNTDPDPLYVSGEIKPKHLVMAYMIVLWELLTLMVFMRLICVLLVRHQTLALLSKQ